MPDLYITRLLQEGVTIYTAYVRLELEERTYETLRPPPYQRIKRPRVPVEASTRRQGIPGPYLGIFEDLDQELQAAKTRCAKEQGLSTPAPNIM